MRVAWLGAALAAVVTFGTPADAVGVNVPAPLDLHAAIRYALAHDPTVLADRATLAQDEATYAKNHAAEFPSVAGSLQNQMAKTNGNNTGTFSQFGLTQAQVFSQNTAQIASNWTLYNGSLNQIQAQEAKRQVEQERATVRRAEQQLASDVASAWYNAVQQREGVRLAEGDRLYQQELLDAAQAQERVGRVAGVDVLRAQVNELRAASNLSSAQASAANASESLAQRIGAAPETPFALPEQLPEPPLPTTPLDALVAVALAARPDIAGARAQIAYARLTDSAIDTDRRPQITLNGAFGHSEVPAQTQMPGFPTINPESAGFWQIGANTTLTIPFIEYGARRAAHAAARAQIDSAVASLESAQNGVEVSVRQALRGAQTAAANLAYAREADQLGAESARIEQLRYRNGLSSITDVTSAEQTALQSAQDLVTARVNYLDALTALRVAVGAADPLDIAVTGGP
ncbi:MAG TPA: TolC family protein [Candidatus Limnocylindria bacterium]|nr:TolC family protein [Candidatus Limnocylindria bacterium]